MRRIFVALLITAATLSAADKTPYNRAIVDNIYAGTNRYTFRGVDFGQPQGSVYEVSHTGTSDWGTTPNMYVMQRDYSGDNVMPVRTAHGSANYVGDSVAVNLHGLFSEVGADGAVSPRADSVVYMKPYMGKILVSRTHTDSPPILSNLYPTSGLRLVGSVDTIRFTVSDNSGLDSLRVWLDRPGRDTVIMSTVFPPGVRSYTRAIIIRWTAEDCGRSYLGVYARDDSDQVTNAPTALALSVARELVDIGDAIIIVNFLFRGGPPPPMPSGDINCDGAINIGDAIHIVNLIFRNAVPVCCQ